VRPTSNRRILASLQSHKSLEIWTLVNSWWAVDWKERSGERESCGGGAIINDNCSTPRAARGLPHIRWRFGNLNRLDRL